MLKIDLRPGDEIKVGDAVVKMVHKSGQLACLVIDAPKDMPIQRVKPKEGQGCITATQLQA